jgi:predicted enzyme related to lactoylglutathione lyase
MTQPRSQTQSAQPYDASIPAPVAAPGRFVWHDLMSTDPATARAFYAALFGWTYRDVDMGPMGTYTMIHVGEMPIGGIVPMDAAQNIPAHWIGYITVDDVDAACARAPELGGTVCVPGTDIPDTGRFAVIADPTGATFSPFTFSSDPLPELPELPAGAFCWDELLTTDPARAGAFYTAIFGWTPIEVDMGELGTYTLFRRGGAEGRDAAGMLRMPPEAGGPPAWLSYVLVDDVDVSARRVQELGGRLYVEPRDIPGIGRFSVAADPTGAAFALYRKA